MGVALAAGAGTRLAPLTLLRPKPLCPVGDRTLLDWALEALGRACDEVVVNAHHHAEQIAAHLGARSGPGVRLSVEEGRALGTAGAIGAVRDVLDGRGALVVNADTWHRADLARLLSGWDGSTVRILTSTAGPFGPRSGVVASTLPWELAKELRPEPSGLWERVWREALAAGRLETLHEGGTVIDCGTPASYLRANLAWSGGAPVLGRGAIVHGTLERAVVWPDSVVAPGERLVDAIRAGPRTVLVR